MNERNYRERPNGQEKPCPGKRANTRSCDRPAQSEHIKVCQVGYLPQEAKFCMLTAEPTGSVAYVRCAESSCTVLTVPIGPVARDSDSDDLIWPIEFSGLCENGIYYLEIPGIGSSCDFQIGPDILARPFRLAMRMFLGQRCGTEVSLAPDFPEYRYGACHTGPALFHPSSGKIGARNCPGGWHDAGDYGRYIVNSGITTGTLLWAFELYADKVGPVGLDLPESGGPLPDMLAEIRWNLDWMLSMQDRDGGVWHKATTAKFCPMIMPDEDTSPTVIVGLGEPHYKGTAATADFAAVCAIAARVYKPFDAAFAQRCLDPATSAWKWLSTTPDVPYIQNPEGIGTGGYGDTDLRDERLWAAAELFRTTGKARYNQYFLAHYGQWTPAIRRTSPQSWPHVVNMAMYAYALSQNGNSEAVGRIREDAVAAADGIVERALKNGYRLPLVPADYVWGSNGVVGNYAMMLLMAHHFRPNKAYLGAALDCLHYLFGRNTFNTSFVTHVGARWPKNPHHRPSAADGIDEPWPGMLVGGPYLKHDAPPARQWFDELASFATNEVAINWNAPLLFALAGLLP